MTTLNLSHVTLTLQQLLRNNVRRLLGGTPESDPVVSLMPPEQVTTTVRALNLHLYHVAEDPHYRNVVGLPNAIPPVHGQPMALRLFYVLTAHMTRSSAFDAETQQQLLGLGMKTFHDFPLVTDDLIILPTPATPPVPVMHPQLLGGKNKIEIIPRNLEPEENLNFWAAEDQKTPRMSAYYEVRTVFLSPEEVTSSGGTVFDVGLYVASSAAAPASTGLGAQALDVTPARVTLQSSAVADKPRVRLTGTNLTSGDEQRITLSQAGGDPVLIDPLLNPDWDVQFGDGEISVIAQVVLVADDGAGGTQNIDVVPGSASFELTVRSYRFQGSNRLNADYKAGKVDVSLGAHIQGAAGPVTGNFTVTVDGVVDLTTVDIGLAVSGEYYTNVSAAAAAPTGPGTFVVTATQVVFQPFFASPFTGAHPVQLFANGAESQPFWIEVP